ncbi:hypothetical protein F5879DRAFT_1003770 [Lentinula edodes]|nr:hypothetical protein F5879DRAFT_1003770 [Lentinula edodes]
MSVPPRFRTEKKLSSTLPASGRARLTPSSPGYPRVDGEHGDAIPDPSFSTLRGAFVRDENFQIEGHLSTASSGFRPEDNDTQAHLSSSSSTNLSIDAYLSDPEIVRGRSEKILPVPVTPERKAISDSALAKAQSTPFSHHSSSYSATALSNDKKYKVEEANKYLMGDLANVRTLPVKEWASLSLNLDVDKDTYELTENIKKKFQDYLKAVKNAKNEMDKELYKSLIALLNELRGNSENIVFYKQDAIPVRGSLVKQTPDIGAVFKELVESRDLLALPHASDEKIFWGLIHTFVEVKHEDGKMIRDDFGADANWSTNKEKNPQNSESGSGQKRVREADSLNETSGRARKAMRSSSSHQMTTVEDSNVDDVPLKARPMPLSMQQYIEQQGNPQDISPAPDRNTPEGVRTQTAGYARDILSNGLPRRHVHSFIVDSTLVRGIFYDHSIIVESAVLNLANKDDQLIFAKMIKQLHALPPVGLGLIPGLEAPFMKDPASLKYGQKLPEFEKAKGPPSNAIFEIKEIEEGSTFTFPYKDGTRTVQLQRILFRSHGIIGRGTIVVRVVCACTHCVPNQCDWSGKKLVLKLSFPSESRVPEQAFMDRCKEEAKGDHAWVLNHLPDIYCSFDIPCGERSPQANFKKKFEDKYEMRFLRGSIQEELQPLSSLKTALECAQVFYDIVQCHHWVHTYPRILHRDISDGNIMVRVKDGKKYGVLNDWDLAIWLDERDVISTSQFRTGTRPYMAHEQHSPDWEGPHRYRHDMESLFYVILLLATLFSNPSEKDHEHSKKRQPYTKWFTQGDDFLLDKKISIIFIILWRPNLTQFFHGFLQWLGRLQQCLYDGFTAYTGFVKRQTDNPHQVLHFNDDTLGGHFSYDRLVWIMHQFSEETLETRGCEWQKKLRGLQKDEDERKK